MAANNLSSQEKSNILNRFDKKNIPLNFALKEINDIKTKKVIETKKAVERKELSNHLNVLNLNNTIKGEFLNKFDKSNGNVSALKNEATNRKSQIVATQRKANRNALSNFLDTINELNETNKKSILNKFDASNSESLNTIKIAAQNLQKRRIVEKRLKNRNDVSKYLNELVPKGLTSNEKNTILKKFNNNVSISANTIKKEASNALNLKIKTKIEANRKNLENFMSNLRISKENQNKILENFNASPNTIDNLKNRATKLNENRRQYEQNMKNVSNKVKQLTNLTNEERKEFLNRVNENGANKVIANAMKLNANRKEEKRLENERRAKEQELKNVTAKLETLNNLDRNNRIKFIERLNSNGANKVIANATKLNTNRKEARRIKAEEEVKVREKLRTLTNLTNEERNLFMNKLETNGANKVIANASKLNINRKEIKKAQEEKNRKEREMKNVANKLQNFTNLTNENRKVFLNRLNENGASKVLSNANKLNANRKAEKKAKEQQLKNVSNKLQILTNLTNEDRKAFMNRLNENGANKVLTNANKLNTNRKEVKRLEEEKRVREQQLKNVSNKLQTLTNLTNENRKKFLNRLNENGANKVLSNANKLNANRKEVKKNVSNKLQTLTNLTNEDRKAFMNRLNENGANKVLTLTNLTNEDRKKFLNRLNENGANKVMANANKLNANRKEKKAKEQQLKNVSNKLQTLTNLTNEDRKKFLNRLNENGANKVMANANKLNANRKNARAEEEAKKKAEEEAKKARNQEKKNVAAKLQALNSLERNNRKKFMNRLNENGANKVMANAQALNKERKNARAEEEAKKKAEEEAKKKAEEAKKARNQEKKNVAAKLQALNSLERNNRKKFMNRLNENGANKVVANAQALNKERKN